MLTHYYTVCINDFETDKVESTDIAQQIVLTLLAFCGVLSALTFL
jgi:hypothetical protein